MSKSKKTAIATRPSVRVLEAQRADIERELAKIEAVKVEQAIVALSTPAAAEVLAAVEALRADKEMPQGLLADQINNVWIVLTKVPEFLQVRKGELEAKLAPPPAQLAAPPTA